MDKLEGNDMTDKHENYKVKMKYSTGHGPIRITHLVVTHKPTGFKVKVPMDRFNNQSHRAMATAVEMIRLGLRA